MGPERDVLSHAEVLGNYLGAFVDELVACGLENVCLCPGSRSTPLALMFARHPAIKIWTHLDERSCAYFALGMAKAGNKPVAILCSSGTAAVNFAPAVVEAFHSCVPLIVLTADRPPELQELNSNQTIDQVRLYGSAVKWFAAMPLPEATPDMLRHVRMLATRTLQTVQAEPKGPVHLNFPLREPLLPAAYIFEAVAGSDAPSMLAAETMPELDGLRGRLMQARRSVIVCGPNSGVAPEMVAGLARRLDAPVLADALSEVRSGAHNDGHVIAAYDSFLRSPGTVATLEPDFVLRFGDPPTGRPLSNYLQRYRDAYQVLVAPPGRWPDPELSADEVLHCNPSALCAALTEGLEANPAAGWLASWQQAESRSQGVAKQMIDAYGRISEPSVVLDLAAAVPEGATVVAGNSMPVRDIDSFWPASQKAQVFQGNRGASGIDGVISTALGTAAMHPRTVLLIGDLSFYHDMNGLLAARRHNLQATIVLVNNDGGGIFSFLPQHADAEHFETLFGTPHGLDFAPVAQIYGVGFQRVTTREEYKAALLASFDSPGVQIIEVRTEREANLKLHNDIWAAVAAALQTGPAK